jgi:hypothetical protein
MRHRLDTLLEEEVEAAKAIEALEMQRYAVSESARTGEKNLEVIVNLKQGQDEVPHEAVVTDYSDAALIRLDVVNHLNSEIRQLGDEKSKVLHRIKDFRKSINMQKWEGALVDAKCRDLDAYYTDLQLLRVTKKLQATLKGGGEAAAAQRQASQRLEARVEMLTKSHAEKVRSGANEATHRWERTDVAPPHPHSNADGQHPYCQCPPRAGPQGPHDRECEP